MTRLLELLLRKWGYDVRTALNAPQALETLMFFRADVAILDIGLPEMDGYELAQRIAATCGAIRLIAMSGFGDEAHRRRSAEAGFAGYLVKPVAALDLKAELERVAYSAIA